MSTQHKIHQVQQYIAALNQHDMGIIEQLYSKTATIEAPVGSEARRGHDEIIAMYTKAFAIDIQAELTGAVRVASNYALFPFRFGFNNAGVPVEVEAIDEFEFDADGRVCSMRAFWGPENMKSQ